jgi:hypothetical protein
MWIAQEDDLLFPILEFNVCFSQPNIINQRWCCSLLLYTLSQDDIIVILSLYTLIQHTNKLVLPKQPLWSHEIFKQQQQQQQQQKQTKRNLILMWGVCVLKWKEGHSHCGIPNPTKYKENLKEPGSCIINPSKHKENLKDQKVKRYKTRTREKQRK